MQEDARQGVIFLSLFQQGEEVSPCVRAVQVSHAVMAEGSTKVDLEKNFLLLKGVSVGLCRVQSGLTDISLRITRKPLVQIEGNLGGINGGSVPGMHPEARGHLSGSNDLIPVCACDRTEITTVIIRNVRVIILHGSRATALENAVAYLRFINNVCVAKYFESSTCTDEFSRSVIIEPLVVPNFDMYKQ